MSEDFFGDLGKSISRYTQNAVDKTSTFFEATKISAQISTEQKEIDKLYQKIGETVYRRAESRQMQLDDDLAAFVEEIRRHREQISSRRKDLADVKGKKVCPSCGELIPREVAFCPKCGAPSPADEDRDKTDQPAEDRSREAQPEENQPRESQTGEAQETQKTQKSQPSREDATLDAEFTELGEAPVEENQTQDRAADQHSGEADQVANGTTRATGIEEDTAEQEAEEIASTTEEAAGSVKEGQQ